MDGEPRVCDPSGVDAAAVSAARARSPEMLRAAILAKLGSSAGTGRAEATARDWLLAT